MFKWILEAFSRIFKFWSELPQESKDKIIQLVVEAFDSVFRAFFKANKPGVS